MLPTPTSPVSAVFGGSRGLGLLIARELLDRGHTTVVLGRDEETRADAVGLLREGRTGGDLRALVCDVADRPRCRARA